MSTVVIGLGNEYRRDDGFGPAVVRALRGRLPAAIRLAVVADGLDLLDVWAHAQLAVVIDLALHAPPTPGRRHRWIVDGAAGPVGGHTVDIAAALALARVLGTAPARVVALMAEGADVGPGVGLSSPVRRAVPVTAAAVTAEVVSGSVRRRGPSPPGARRVR